MAVREISREECLLVLAGARLVRLGCARENQPYVVPVYLAYDQASGCLYGFTTPGQKVDWMRDNPLVCVQADAVTSHDQWVSVVIFGRYEELTESPGKDVVRLRAQERSQRAAHIASSPTDGPCQDDERCEYERDRAWCVLGTHPAWGEPVTTLWAGRARPHPADPFVPIYYKVWIDRVTGHEVTPDAARALPAPEGRWLRRTLVRLFGGKSKDVGSTP